MFTGIVQTTVPILALDRTEGLVTMKLELGALADGLTRGASVSVSGVCLTATEIENGAVSFDLMGETLQKTSLGSLMVGDRVNVERSARMGDEIGGHRVSGHITGMATITRVETPPNNRIITLSCDPRLMEYILPKGFIALDGCSLTIVDVGPDWFTVHLIPETLKMTTFGQKGVGAPVNLELDPATQAIVETIKNILSKKRT